MQCAEVIAESVWLLSKLQKDRFNSLPYYRIIVQRRRIQREIWNVEHIIGENLMRCALFGKDHPLFPLWVYKCAEKLEYVSRFVDKIDAISAMGVPTEFHVYQGLGHGFGLGTGTVAEGWFDLAVNFWEENR